MDLGADIEIGSRLPPVAGTGALTDGGLGFSSSSSSPFMLRISEWEQPSSGSLIFQSAAASPANQRFGEICLVYLITLLFCIVFGLLLCFVEENIAVF